MYRALSLLDFATIPLRKPSTSKEKKKAGICKGRRIVAKLFNHQGNDEELTYRLKPYSEERDLKQRIMGITEPEEPTSQKKIYLSETSLDCANVYRSQEPSIPDSRPKTLVTVAVGFDQGRHRQRSIEEGQQLFSQSASYSIWFYHHREIDRSPRGKR